MVNNVELGLFNFHDPDCAYQLHGSIYCRTCSYDAGQARKKEGFDPFIDGCDKHRSLKGRHTSARPLSPEWGLMPDEIQCC
jgi:hypothetical protein